MPPPSDATSARLFNHLRTTYCPTRPLLLDGGLATTLELAGHDIATRLWSARLLADDPSAVQTIHAAFLRHGAHIATSATYQATTQGIAAELGGTNEEAAALIARGVSIARAARDEFVAAKGMGRGRSIARFDSPLVAASVGPFGAFLADGSEYVGDYAATAKELELFHRPRLEILANASPDLVAFETVPVIKEAIAMARLAKPVPHGSAAAGATTEGASSKRGTATHGIPFWISFQCPRIPTSGIPIIASGERLSDAVAAVAAELPGGEAVRARLLALGFNCFHPADARALVTHIRAAIAEHWKDPLEAPGVVCYPNSGELYDPEAMAWRKAGGDSEVHWWAQEVAGCGADFIGGCCRSTPHHIYSVAEILRKEGRLVENS
mmetsp:Transcript_3899/g.10146  ORF Transcript_3899/g.10146 Transcript_3899/m.10146 type:complete len:382 (+) Transcript_3899:92-1237(+)|eukprot:CAMPEP_0184723030 /NCGR_PEP_ID=MMETSP0314-20130426/23905_1 /TAXON_ID=38298 /ORGANISM="Rhodella maculata, Strain CCMP 736" /LENGTH=381 /DNA_ID=CAMNT_0027187741 /DNA_START=56 /DNA_END=1201 /DNA_ORIENTATION=-